MRFLRHLLLPFLLPFLLLIVVFEEEQREHSQDAADADADGFALHTGSEEGTSILAWSIDKAILLYFK